MFSQNSRVSQYKVPQSMEQSKNNYNYQQFKKSFNFKDLAKSNKSNKSDQNQEPFQLKRQSKIRYVQSPVVNRYTSRQNVFYQKNQNQPANLNRKSSKQYSSESKSNFYMPTDSRSPYKMFDKQNQVSQKKPFQEMITQYAANELIYKTQKQMMSTIIERQKLQIKQYEQKAEQYWKQRQKLMRLKSRNQILERQYQIVKEQNQRLKRDSTHYIYSFEGDKTSGRIHVKQRQNNPVNNNNYDINSFKTILNRTQSYQSNNQADSLKQQINQLKRKTQKFLQEKSNFQVKLHDYEKQMAQLKVINQNQISRIQILQTDKEKYMNNYKLLKKDRQKQKIKDSEKLNQIQLIKTQLNSKQVQIASMQQEIQRYKNQSKKLLRLISDKEQQVRISKRENTSLKQNVSELQQKFMRVKNNYIDQSKTINQDVNQYKKKNMHLKIENSQLEESILKIKKQNTTMTIKLCEYQAKLQKLQMQHLNTIEVVKDAKLKVANQNNKQRNYQSMLAQLNKQAQQSQNQIKKNWKTKLSQQTQKMNMERNDLNIIMQGKQNEVMNLRRQIQQLLKELIKYKGCAQRQKKLQALTKYQMNIGEAVSHLWSVKEIQYLKVNKILEGLKLKQSTIYDKNKLQVIRQSNNEALQINQSFDQLRSNQLYLQQKLKLNQQKVNE